MAWIARLALLLAVSVTADSARMHLNGSTRLVMLCTKVDEEVWGSVRTCFYDCAGYPQSITIPKAQWCPLLLSH